MRGREAAMPVVAYLFVECTARRARGVLARLKQIPGVQDAHVVTGPYDIIAVVDAVDQATIIAEILWRVEQIPGVKRNTTNLVVR
jgi:DNA-binding Lrp family transcriptional regulator